MNKTHIDLHRLQTHSPSISAENIQPLQITHELNTRKITTNDVYEQACNMTAWQQLYDQLHPGVFQGSLFEVWLDGIQFFKETTNLALRQSCVVWPGAIWFGIPKSNSQDSFVCGSKVTDGNIVTNVGGEEFELLTPDGLELVGLAVLESELQSIYELDTGHDYSKAAFHRNPSLEVDERKRNIYWYFINEIMQYIEIGPKNSIQKNAKKILKDTLLLGIVDLLSSATPSRSMKASRANYKKIISKSRDYILAHPDDAITILDLCNNLHVSRRTLQNAFQNILNICPTRYLKAIRLNAVRRELISRNASFNTIQDAATSWGFWHLSQFAADYHHFFKELPSESLITRGIADNKIINL